MERDNYVETFGYVKSSSVGMPNHVPGLCSKIETDTQTTHKHALDPVDPCQSFAAWDNCHTYETVVWCVLSRKGIRKGYTAKPVGT